MQPHAQLIEHKTEGIGRESEHLNAGYDASIRSSLMSGCRIQWRIIFNLQSDAAMQLLLTS
jgi:hypothetical protein